MGSEISRIDAWIAYISYPRHFDGRPRASSAVGGGSAKGRGKANKSHVVQPRTDPVHLQRLREKQDRLYAVEAVRKTTQEKKSAVCPFY